MADTNTSQPLGAEAGPINGAPAGYAEFLANVKRDPAATLKQALESGDKSVALHYLNTDGYVPCQGITYATVLGWTDGTGVWVLEGSKQSHEAVESIDATNLSRNEVLEKCGAKYYEHWNDCPITRQIVADEMEDESKRHLYLEKLEYAKGRLGEMNDMSKL